MGNRMTDVGKMRSRLNAEHRRGIFDGKKNSRLGTEKNPAVVTVQTEDKFKEVVAAFEKNGWRYRISLEPEQPEDVADLTRLLNPPKTVTVPKKIGRNDPCPCGSGKKYKLCCSR
ncbi:MAG TPA: PBPRA1643 family SWIM/SEC-C metal-binding motif protein [Blastocatellia bacterium]|nr:PBPRA1643 family SWIM/SEC-C metal-binding motif protein [Blastocatellia bacterium]